LSSSDNPQLDTPPVSQPVPQDFPAENPSTPTVVETSIPAAATIAAAAPPPAENPVWNFWDVLLLALLTFVSMVVLQVSVLLIGRALVYHGLSLAELAKQPILLLISQFLIYLPIAACMIVVVEGRYHVRFWDAIHWNWPRSPWTYLGIGVVVFMVLLFLESLLPMPKDTPFDQLFDRPLDAYLIMILAVAVAPLMEELFFRGFLYPVLARRLGAVAGVALSALPFGLLHLQQYGWSLSAGLIIFLVGVVCGAVRAATKSVGAAFLVHVGYNGAQMLIAVLATRGFTHMPHP
jgi:hypothetical protein